MLAVLNKEAGGLKVQTVYVEEISDGRVGASNGGKTLWHQF